MHPTNKPRYLVNSFMANSRLIKSLSSTLFTVNNNQTADVVCGKWSLVVLTMQYHIKFPRYINNKLSELLQKNDQNRLLVLVLI